MEGVLNLDRTTKQRDLDLLTCSIFFSSEQHTLWMKYGTIN
jgi:hypothetical protein